MLSHKILTRQDINRAANYYEDSADDYYSKDGSASEWQGKGAKILKLIGAVDSAQLRKLMAGEVGLSKNTRLSTRQDSNNRIGIDLTFSAPKSVSMQALIAIDDKIIKAHDRSVKCALKAAEQRAQTRKKVNGKSQVETTGNLIVAKFRHETSRERDPQLHTHAVVMNLTQRSDRQWRALRNDDIIKMTRYLGAVYRTELAIELRKAGYEIRYEREGMFELAHISRAQIEGFSSRSTQIEKKLAERELTRQTATTQQKQLATMETRKHKVSTAREIIFDDWQARAKELNIVFDRDGGKTLTSKGKEFKNQTTLDKFTRTEAAKRALRFAINHLTERQSVMKESILLDTAMRQAIGAARLPDIESELKKQIKQGYLIAEDPLYLPLDQIATGQGKTKQMWITELTDNGMNKRKANAYIKEAIKHGSLVRSEPRYTTQRALEQEQYILQSELSGRNIFTPIMDADAAKLRLAIGGLNKGQTEAASAVLTTKNRIIGIEGFAGTGKSHMLKVAKTIIEENGYHVQALASYGAQVKALRELGVKANTLASFLRAKDKNINDRTVLVIDEAGVVPARLMKQTLRLVEKTGVRVVLIGDTKQTKAIEAGRPFSQLQSAGMQTAYMKQIQRQKNKVLKEAVELAAKGRLTGSLKCISSIIEVKNNMERQAAIAHDYVKLPAAERSRTIIVSGTNEARRDINHAVRKGLNLAEHGVEFNILIRRDITKAESRFSKHYYIGDIIQPEKDYAKTGLKLNELYKIENTGPNNQLTVRAKSGECFKFNPLINQKLSVYRPERIELSTGDIVRITRNDAKLGLVNGDRLKVGALKTGHILLTDGNKQLKLATDKPLYVDYAYATTAHSSQGLTTERVLIDINTKSLTTAKDVYYVAISRARSEARIYTDNIKGLPKAITRENNKSAALDIAKSKNVQKFKDHSHK